MGLMASTETSHEAEGTLVNAGWMYKKGKIVSNWKRRYFELFTDGKLYYYSDETKRTKQTQKGVADLSIIIGLNTVDNKNFEVITPTRIWCFQCKFKSECEEWIQSMKNVENSYLHHDADKPNKRDYLNLSKNESVLKLIARMGHHSGETILYSDQIIKINPKQKQQTRILLLTNFALYNIKPNESNSYKKCQKRIPFDKIPCCTIITTQQFQIDVFIYKTDTKNIKTIIKTLIKADVELIYERDEDEKEFNEMLTFEEDKDDNIQDILPYSDYSDTDHAQNKSRQSIRGKSKKKEKLNVENYDENAVLFQDDKEDDIDDEKEEEDEKKAEKVTKVKKKRRRRRFETKKLKVRDFEFMQVIGRGTFGKILLVKKKEDNKIYAMKILKKTQIIASGQEKNINAEREVLKCIKHPFLMSLRYAFQNEAKLYLVLDYYRGGELMFHLKKKRKFTELEAKFILCQILLALGCLHSNNIVYRDLKPENILLDEIGNCCLCDFGLCKKLGDSDKTDEFKNTPLKDVKSKSTDTFCGTPEYLAPEIIREMAYDKNVDWWSFGILAFELTVGIVPFFSSSNTEMYKKITDSPLMMASWIATDCQDLIKALLQREVRNRLGFVRDVEDIKEHRWFGDVDWQKVFDKEIEAPYIPQMENEDDVADTTCVASKYLEEKASDTFTDKVPQINEQELFRGFTFRPDIDGDDVMGVFGGGSISAVNVNDGGVDSNDNTLNSVMGDSIGQLNEAEEEEEDEDEEHKSSENAEI